MNSLSVGIELVNTGTEPFPPAQIAKLLVLLEDITSRHRIPKLLVVGHSDVEPIRKNDPSAFFPWKALGERGFGLWPDATLTDPPAGFEPWPALQRIGYAVKDRAATVRAFHRHYRAVEGTELDAEDSRILFNLEQKLLTGNR
jgi:N-acetylmuramoyl-L-alanine amidase